ncbi:uncharacterized protein [Miscanthus floridulus]|uniref:uncharacterized protein n=1 Tax=Miscanthus floridulus TaxID=154761 RepID=UPI0034591CBF
MARVEGQRAAEWATTAEQGLEAAKAHQVETKVGLRTSLANTEVALQESLEALESERAALVSERSALESARKALEAEQRALEVERNARSEMDQEVLVLRGWVMGMEEASARLREQVARQAEDLSTLENFHVELGGKVKTLERDLETIKATFSQSVEELTKSDEERRALEGDLDQIHNIAQLVISEVFGSAPSTSTPAVQLVEVLDVVRDLIRSGLFYRASGVLTSVAMHHPNLDFAAICIGYAKGLSMEDI